MSFGKYLSIISFLILIFSCKEETHPLDTGTYEFRYLIGEYLYPDSVAIQITPEWRCRFAFYGEEVNMEVAPTKYKELASLHQEFGHKVFVRLPILRSLLFGVKKIQVLKCLENGVLEDVSNDTYILMNNYKRFIELDYPAGNSVVDYQYPKSISSLTNEDLIWLDSYLEFIGGEINNKDYIIQVTLDNGTVFRSKKIEE